jgi:phosphatidylinositol glycan class B
VLGFSPALPLWRGAFARIWGWRHSLVAKAVTALSVLAMIYFALYPFGIRPHMPMARYLYRHWQGPVYSLGQPFQSYPMFRPGGFRSARLENEAALNAQLAQGPVLLMSETPAPPSLPADAHTTLLFSEFPLARFGWGQAGADYIRGYSEFAARHRFLKLLPLYWYTVYRVERSATIRS